LLDSDDVAAHKGRAIDYSSAQQKQRSRSYTGEGRLYLPVGAVKSMETSKRIEDVKKQQQRFFSHDNQARDLLGMRPPTGLSVLE